MTAGLLAAGETAMLHFSIDFREIQLIDLLLNHDLLFFNLVHLFLQRGLERAAPLIGV